MSKEVVRKGTEHMQNENRLSQTRAKEIPTRLQFRKNSIFFFLVTLMLIGCGEHAPPAAASNLELTPTPSDKTAPTVPANFTAAMGGDARIELSWTASTDDVGIPSYELERCAGTTCTNFAPIAAPPASPYNDTVSSSPNTTYRYRLRAADQAGNFSEFSTIATQITPDGVQLPLGALTHDGPSTPEQISLILPVTGSLPTSATATVRYKSSDTLIWKTGHPMYRIRPDFTITPNVGTVSDAFAWPIIDVAPGTPYDIEVTVISDTTTNIKTLTHTTRALPAAAGTPNKTANSAATIASQFASLNAGDVLEIADGTYNVSRLQLSRSGTTEKPIYIRGASRAGVVLSNPGRILQILGASNVVIENMTLQGSGVDSGVNTSSLGIEFYDRTPNQARITIRNVTILGVDSAIGAHKEISEFLAYDSTITGNNTWNRASINSNATWNDDGIRIPGFGNCVFNNTIKGFGDSMSFAQHNTQVIGVHFYRNDVLMGGDDATEVDEAQRNLTFYDNRIRNTMTLISLDPLYGGPFLAARNIAINIGRTPFKWNSTNSGQFIYSNTIARTTGKEFFDGVPEESGWYQPNNGDQRAYGYQNNILVYRGVGTQTIRLNNTGHDPIDFTHNSWFPDLRFQWRQGRFLNLADAYSKLTATTPVFSNSTKRHEQDNITVSNPWTTPITLGTDYLTEVTTAYIPALSVGTAPKNSGVVIHNTTDGFTGGAPDRGAIIEGRTTPLYGDRSQP